MEKHFAVKKNHTIPIVLGIIIVILIITVLFQTRRIHDLEKVNSNFYKTEKEQAESNTEVIPSDKNSDNIYSEKYKSTEADNEYQDRINKLESKIADMKEWQDYLEETIDKENKKEEANNDRMYKAMKSSLSSRFESFAEENNLYANKKTELIELLTERELEYRDLYTNNSNRENIQKERENIQLNYDNLISDLLSQEDYIAYKEYLESEQDRNRVRSLKRSALTGDNQLNKQQEKDLVAAIYMKRLDLEDTEEIKELRTKRGPRNKEDMIKMLNAQKELYNGYLEAAKDILTDSQMKKYHEYIDRQISSIEISAKQYSLTLGISLGTEKADE